MECSWYRSKVHTEVTSRQSLAYIPALSPWLLAHSPENPTRPPTLKWTDCATTPCKGVRSALSRFPTGYQPAGWLLPDPRICRTRNIPPVHSNCFESLSCPFTRRGGASNLACNDRSDQSSSAFLFLSLRKERRDRYSPQIPSFSLVPRKNDSGRNSDRTSSVSYAMPLRSRYTVIFFRSLR